MIPAISGQQGSASIGGSLAGLIGGESTDDKLKPRYYLPGLYWRSRNLTRLIDPKDIQSAYDQFKSLYEPNTARATANAPYYENLTKGIFEDKTTPNSIASEYLNTVGDYINRGRNDLGQQAQSLANTDALRMGLGNTAPSTANSIALSTRLGGLFAPLYGAGIANSAPFANAAYGQQKAWDQYRLGQFQNDPLTGYYDRAAYRSFEPLNQLYGGVGRATDALGNILNRTIIPNVAGYDLIPGLGSRLNNFAAGTMNAVNWGLDTYKSAMGLGGLGGGMGGGTPGAGGSMGPAQNQQWMNEFNGVQGPNSGQWTPSYGGTGGGYYPSQLPPNPNLNPAPVSFGSPPYIPPATSPSFSPGQNWYQQNGGMPPISSYYPGLSTYYG